MVTGRSGGGRIFEMSGPDFSGGRRFWDRSVGSDGQWKAGDRLWQGGTLETVISYDQKEKTAGSIPTGLFFHEANGASLVDAIERFVTIENEFDPLAIRNHTLKWDREIFKEKMKDSILNKMKSA